MGKSKEGIIEIEVTNSGGEVMNRVGDEAEKQTALTNPRITNQQNLEGVIETAISYSGTRTHVSFRAVFSGFGE